MMSKTSPSTVQPSECCLCSTRSESAPLTGTEPDWPYTASPRWSSGAAPTLQAWTKGPTRGRRPMPQQAQWPPRPCGTQPQPFSQLHLLEHAPQDQGLSRNLWARPWKFTQQDSPQGRPQGGHPGTALPPYCPISPTLERVICSTLHAIWGGGDKEVERQNFLQGASIPIREDRP